MRVCLLGATFTTSNLGVNALMAGAIKCIHHTFPDADIFVLDYGRQSLSFEVRIDEQTLSIPMVNMRFSKTFYLRNNVAMLILLAVILRVIPSKRLRQRIVAGNPCLKQIHDADLIASLAGGDSFSDIYGMRRLLYTSLPQVLVLLLGKRLALLPQTLGPFKGRVAKAIARYILTRAEIIYSRDRQGLEETQVLLRSKADARRVRFCYDVGFVLAPRTPPGLGLAGLGEPRPAGSCLVGLNVSGLLYTAALNHRDRFGLRIDYDKLVHELVSLLIERHRAHVLLIPHVFGSDGESDSAVCRGLYGQLRTKYGAMLGLAGGSYDESEIKHVIGLCDFFVGSRMHACIAAISQSVPAVSIAYSGKFIGVMQAAGVEDLVADARKMNHEEILELVAKAYTGRSEISQRLAQTMPKVKETVLTLFDAFADLAIAADSSTLNRPVAVSASNSTADARPRPRWRY